MNYMVEIRMFYDWLLYNPLPTGSIALWQGLMSINNKAGWADEFTVANIVLQGITGLSRQGLDRARNILVQKGLITYKKGTSNQAGRYKILSFECKKVGTPGAENNLECKKVGTVVGTKRSQDDTQGGHSSSTLNKLNETKLKDDDNACAQEKINIFKTWEQNIGMLSPIVIQKLADWQSDMPDDAICKAIEIAVLNNARNWGYVNTILNNWHKQNIKSLDAVDGEERKRSELKARKAYKPAKKSFNNIQGRDWDFENIEKLQAERIQHQIGEINESDNEELKQRLSVIEGGTA